MVGDLTLRLQDCTADAAWDLQSVAMMDHAGALLLWRTWGQRRAGRLALRPEHEAMFARLSPPLQEPAPAPRRDWRTSITFLGGGALALADHLIAAVSLLGDKNQAQLSPGIVYRLAYLDAARADYALRIEIEDFSQSFNTADRSQVTIRIRAILVNLSNSTLHAQRTFSVERPAAPDAEGAARALAQAADAVIESLLEWTTQDLNLKAG